MPTAIDDILSEVLRLLAERAGMAAESCGVPSVAHALRTRITATEAASSQDYLRCLQVDPAEVQELIEELVVPETWFFRDMIAFRCLARQLELARAGNPATFRVLSAGCSTGEEVYSLAIALRRAGFEPTQFLVLGTDVSRRSLDLAQKGAFAARSFREGDETIGALYRQWGANNGESWQIRQELQAGVEFRWENLAQLEYLAGASPFQVIFCRNVLIYFHAEARRTAVRNLRRLLARDGLLFSAPAEARIFSEAGFGSLGSECPFAFRRPDAAESVAAVQWPKANSPPLTGGSAPLPPASSPPVRSLALPVPTRRNDGDAQRPNTVAAAIPVEVLQPAILQAAEQAADDGRLEEADALCSQVLSRDPASAGAHYLRGVILQAQGGFDEAQRSLEKALYLDPRHYQALVHMMLLAEQRGDRQAAANFRRRAQRAALPETQ